MTITAMQAMESAVQTVYLGKRRKLESAFGPLFANHPWDLLLPHHLGTAHGEPTLYLISARNTSLWLDMTGPIAFPYPESIAQWPLFEGGREPYWSRRWALDYVARLLDLQRAMHAYDEAQQRKETSNG
jgi:hypothetical protein